MDTPPLLQHFRAHDVPLVLSRSGEPVWDDAELHRTAQLSDPEGYALLALVPGVLPWQRARVLLRTLAATQDGLDERTRATLAKATRALMFGLPPAYALTALLALRRLRANHKHVTRAVVAFVLEHPEADALIEARRPALVDCFEHALGKTTARACARLITEAAATTEAAVTTEAADTTEATHTTEATDTSGMAGGDGGRYLRRSLLRFTADPVLAAKRVRALYAPGTYGVPAPQEPPAPLDPVREYPPIVTPTNRGDIAATLVHLYQGGPVAELRPALAGYVARATRGLPRLDASVAMVLDTSGSMRGYGEREWAVMSQAVALRLVLAEVCDRFTVVETGGTERAPAGSADLAGGLLDALGAGPDLVVVVTDGYENHLPGDLARVAATLPRAGVTTPVVRCLAAFTKGDDLTLRDPAPGLPGQAFWHEDDFAALLPWMFAHCAPGAEWIRATMLGRLEGGRT
ncbi:vWA domain-containing protein [Nonomuraea fuscirosea]|uniref:vWA domain-containing protein n=1 Tax=Nonomuraea fuscirosea TaxID=1291556 RepID=UPI003415A29C